MPTIDSTEEIGGVIRTDRTTQGLSLQGLANKLNQDRSLGLERKITTSWLHHLENGRAKAMTPEMKKGIARALSQDENKYLNGEEAPHTRAAGFARFFDDQCGSFEPNSTLICDIFTDFTRAEDLGEILLCLYNFLISTEGKIIVFEKSSHLSLPIFLAAIRTHPQVEDTNLNTIVSQILTPVVTGGFVNCELPEPTPEQLKWVTDSLEMYESTADEQARSLIETDPLNYLAVISPNSEQGMPTRKSYYYLGKKEYGLLDKTVSQMAYHRFQQYRKLGLFSRNRYEDNFPAIYQEMAQNYSIVFG